MVCAAGGRISGAMAGGARRPVAVEAVTGAPTVLLTGGLGGAHLAPALARALGPGRLTVVVNVGDDLDWYGLRVCPDLDTVLYALGRCLDRTRGWGLTGETFTVSSTLEAMGEPAWFGIGDRDLATHLVRTGLLRAGRTLSSATKELAGRLGVEDPDVVPAADVACPTRIGLVDGRWTGFQEWYVGMKAAAPVRSVELGRGPAAPAALAAVAEAGTVVLGPSNPVTSIGTILALDGMAEAVARVGRVVAVSPTVGAVPPTGAVAHHTRARRHLLAASGDEDSAAGVARYYARRHPGLVGTFVLDAGDADDLQAVADLGIDPVTAPLMDPDGLARAVVEARWPPSTARFHPIVCRSPSRGPTDR